MTVCPAKMKENTFFIFRNDGSEVEVVLEYGEIIHTSKTLTDEEKLYFLNHRYKDEFYG